MSELGGRLVRRCPSDEERLNFSALEGSVHNSGRVMADRRKCLKAYNVFFGLGIFSNCHAPA